MRANPTALDETGSLALTADLVAVAGSVSGGTTVTFCVVDGQTCEACDPFDPSCAPTAPVRVEGATATLDADPSATATLLYDDDVDEILVRINAAPPEWPAGGAATREREILVQRPVPAASAPVVEDIAVTEDGDLLVSATLTDPDDDLEGGSLAVVVDGVALSAAVPGELDAWDGTIATVSVPLSPCTQRGRDLPVLATATDAAGNTGPTASTTAVPEGVGYTLLETGAAATDLGLVPTVTSICGDIAEADNDGVVVTGDLDTLHFEPAVSGFWTLTLTWDQSADYQLVVTDLASGVATRGDTGTVGLEELLVELTATVEGWLGDPGPWTLELRGP